MILCAAATLQIHESERALCLGSALIGCFAIQHTIMEPDTTLRMVSLRCSERTSSNRPTPSAASRKLVSAEVRDMDARPEKGNAPPWTHGNGQGDAQVQWGWP